MPDKTVEQLKSKEVWLVGKGPSLDRYDWSKAGPYRIGINETAFLIPDCWGAIALDHSVLSKYNVSLDPNIMVFRKSTHVDYNYKKMYIWVKGIEVFDLCATAPVMIQLLSYLGVNKIHFVGFDSIDGDTNYSNNIKDIKAEGETRDGYANINEHLLKLIDELGVEAIWEHRHL